MNEIFILVYGSPYIEERQVVWESIRNINSLNSNKILLIGDFNQVEYHCQKLGGTTNIQGRESFMKWRMECQLTELSIM